MNLRRRRESGPAVYWKNTAKPGSCSRRHSASRLSARKASSEGVAASLKKTCAC